MSGGRHPSSLLRSSRRQWQLSPRARGPGLAVGWGRLLAANARRVVAVAAGLVKVVGPRGLGWR